jgi:hypothetical protein
MCDTEFYLTQFYETIALSLMGIDKGIVSDALASGKVTFEADDIDDVKIELEWIAIKETHQSQGISNFLTSKKIKDWVIGFKKDSVNDSIEAIALIDDATELAFPKEKQISLIKEFIHENFLWEKDIYNQILINT